MCNLYSITKSQDAIRALTRAVRDVSGNLPALPGVYPDTFAPIVRNGVSGERELAKARWGMPTPQNILMQGAKKKAVAHDKKSKPYNFKVLLRMERDPGVTNIRNIGSKHWQCWLGIEHRCVVPFTSFSEFNAAEGGHIWFAFGEKRPQAAFAGIWTNWTSVRKGKEGETTNDLFGFLTTEPNDEVGRVHPKAMPVILRTTEEIDTWLSSPVDQVPSMQRPLPDGTLRVVARGKDQDGEAE